MISLVNFLLMVVLLLAPVSTFAQGTFEIVAKKTSTAPVIDGRLDEDVWTDGTAVEGFIQIEPNFGRLSPVRTRAWIVYDDHALYVAFSCSDPNPGELAAAITGRDGELDNDDAVMVLFDTFDDDQTCYFFSTNLLGTQLDGRIADNGRSVDTNWDGSWKCSAIRNEKGWSAEFSIPFEIMKFKGGKERRWGVNYARSYPRRLEMSTWAGPAESLWKVSQFGVLTGLDLDIQRLKRYEAIPYVMARVQANEKSDSEVGLDMRASVSSNISADLTLNPDFATVEADVEDINLSRFELFIPEKRPFFLEGAEMFSQRIKQFYSRRIGEIPWGIKTSGKIGSWDMALIAARSDPAKTASANGAVDGEDATYSVIRLKKSLFGASNIGFLAVNRNYLGDDTGSIGLDTTLFFTPTFGMTAQFIRAHGPTDDGKLAWFVRPSYDSAASHFHVRYTNLDENLRTNMNALGFLNDDNRKEFDTNISHEFWFKDSWLEQVDASVNYNRYWSQENVLRSWELDANVEFVLVSKWEIELEYTDELERFEKDFRNRISSVQLGYDTRRGSSFHVSLGTGENYDSDLSLVEAGAAMKLSDALRISYGLTRLQLDPDPEEESTWIHVLRLNYFFNENLFLKLFYQTNSVIDKRNSQVLFVWRFLPPFGSLQVAFQRGTSRFGTRSDQGNTLFTKFSWVF